MKRTAFLALATAVFAGCEQATAPASLPLPNAEVVAPAATTFSGRAVVVQATVLNVASFSLGDTGPLPEQGGALNASLLTIGVSKDQTAGILALSAEVGSAATVGQGSTSSANASVAEVRMDVANNVVEAGLLRSQAEATCDGQGRASASGSSQLARLVVNGEEIVVTGAPNQRIDLPNGWIIINEQSSRVEGNEAEITVNALHVTTFVPLTGELLADVVISSAHADITCAAAACDPPAGDFVTGGGWITGTPSEARGNFGVGGGIKQNGLWGHLTYIDHGTNGPKVKGTGVTAYRVTGPFSRRIEGTAEVDGAGGFTYTVDVTDNGEPGREDTFEILLSNGYRAEGQLRGGNIQLHAKPCL